MPARAVPPTLLKSTLALAVGVALGVGALYFTQGRSSALGRDGQPAAEPGTNVLSTRGDEEVGWLKGQLHAHSSNSGDSRTPPDEVLRWYEGRGFDFVVFTDHNHVTATSSSTRTLAIPGVELTQNYKTCTPPPEPGHGCLLHVNALFADPKSPLPSWPPDHEGGDRYGAFRAALEATRELGGIAQLNHPNFHYALDAALIARLAQDGAVLLEVANEASDSNNAGDRAHPSTEALWDQALTAGARIWGTATDDAHHYDDAEKTRARGEVAFEGDKGFVMVRAQKDPASIRAALEQGRFYASSGVVLSRVEEKGGRLFIDVAPQSPGEHAFAFFGTGGALLGDVKGRSAVFALEQAQGGYVRAVVTGPEGQKAWTQPLFIP